MAPKSKPTTKVIKSLLKTTRVFKTAVRITLPTKQPLHDSKEDHIFSSPQKPTPTHEHQHSIPNKTHVENPPQKKKSKDVGGEEEEEVQTAVEGGDDGAEEKKRRRRRRRRKAEEGEYRVYVYKVLKQVHPCAGVSGKAMGVMNSYMHDMFERLSTAAAGLSAYGGRMTLTARDMEGAVRLVLPPGELCVQAVDVGNKAVAAYTAAVRGRK